MINGEQTIVKGHNKEVVNEMNMPKEIERYLVTGETIEKEFFLRGRFSLTGCKVYASNKRLFITQSNSIKDIDYSHISSIELKHEGSLPAVVVGLMCLAGSVTLLSLGLTFWWAWVLGACGILSLILGLIKKQFVSMIVVGRTSPEKLSGYRSELDSLFRIVREKGIHEKS